MKEFYCIYSNSNFHRDEMNDEHILPMSLGGANNFSLLVNSEINSQLGSKIDGRLTSDYLISCLRRRMQWIGHSGKEPKIILKNVRIKNSNSPVQLKFDSSGRHVFDLINKRYLTHNERTGVEFSINMYFDKYVRTLFIAKTVLSTGFRIYKQRFLDYADHDSLRDYMNFAFHKSEDQIKSLDIRLMDSFIELEDEISNQTRNYFKSISKLLNCSLVMFVVCSEHILASVALGGTYLGTINFKVDASQFQDQGKLEGGFIIGIQNGKAICSSFNYIEELITRKNTKKRYE